MRRNFNKAMEQILDSGRKAGLPIDFMIAVGRASRDNTESKEVRSNQGNAVQSTPKDGEGNE